MRVLYATHSRIESVTSSRWTVYIIEAKNGALYTGITTDLARRLNEHIVGAKGAKFFRSSNPNRILFQETQPDRSSASKREAEIKKLSRADKLILVNDNRTVNRCD